MHKTILFLHIPKTAGSTLNAYFSRRYDEKSVFLSGVNGTTHVEDSTTYARLPKAQRQSYRYVGGHLEIDALKGLDNKVAFTFLRSPVSRLISLYRFVRRTKEHHLHTLVQSTQMSLGEFVATASWDEVRNGMTRRLCGIEDVELPTYDERLVCTAMGNLDALFDFVGIQESFDKSFYLLGKMLDISPEELMYTSRNIGTAPKNKQAQVDLALVKKHNQMDEQVYQFARRKFQEMAARLKNGKDKQGYKAFKRVLATARKQAA